MINDYAFLFPLAFLVAGVLAYVAHKRHWKIADII